MVNDGPMMRLVEDLVEMGFPKKMAKTMVREAFAKAGKDSKSIHNTLPAFYVDGDDIILIDTSMGLKL